MKAKEWTKTTFHTKCLLFWHLSLLHPSSATFKMYHTWEEMDCWYTPTPYVNQFNHY